eukprot:COSAG01_NODE_56349_length_319_cov_0.609091_1_plen_89_part_10
MRSAINNAVNNVAVLCRLCTCCVRAPAGGARADDRDRRVAPFTDRQRLVGFSVVSRPFPSWHRSMLTEIYLCHAGSGHEISRTETAGQV